jgi:hypothetical protein
VPRWAYCCLYMAFKIPDIPEPDYHLGMRT